MPRLALHVLPAAVELRAEHRDHRLLRFELARALRERRGLRVEFGLLAVEPLGLGAKSILFAGREPHRLFPLGGVALELFQPDIDFLRAGGQTAFGLFRRGRTAFKPDEVVLEARAVEFKLVAGGANQAFAVGHHLFAGR